MKRLPVLATLALLVSWACSSSPAAPKGLDPTVFITNTLAAPDTLFFTWRDGQGVTGSVAVPPGGTSCTRFLAQADSAYFEAHWSDSTSHEFATYVQPWFDPSTHPAWTMTTGHAYILVTDVSPTEPC